MKISEAILIKNPVSYERKLTREEQMLRRHMEKEIQSNGKQVQKFYTDVLATLTEKLIKEYRYTNKVHQDEIMEMEKIIKEKLSKQKLQGLNPMFKKIRIEKEEIKQQCPYFNRQTFEQQKKKPIQNVISNVKEEAFEDIIYKHEYEKSAEDEEVYIDDLADFVVPQDNINIKEEAVSIQQKEQPYIYSQCKEEVRVKEERCRQLQLEYQTIDEESEKDQHYNTEIEERIGTSVLGSFQSFQVRRIPKENKIRMNMENVFVKFSNGRSENYFSNLSITLTKVEKATIKQINN